jgi:hypothetical protein
MVKEKTRVSRVTAGLGSHGLALSEEAVRLGVPKQLLLTQPSYSAVDTPHTEGDGVFLCGV